MAEKRGKKYQMVATRIETMVRAGALATGGKIPSVRDMAAQMGLSVMTVLAGYRLLEDRGVIESRPQSGYYVRSPHRRLHPAAADLPGAPLEPIRLQAARVELSAHVERLIMGPQEGVVPLGAGFPAPEFFPSIQLSRRLARAVRRDPDGMNRYSTGMGDLRLRTALARRMHEAGCGVKPEEIVVTAGATQALLLALRAVTAPGDTVAVESPGYFGFYSLLNFLNLRALEIPSSPDTGFSVDSLDRIIARKERVAAVLLCANFSNPTGAAMPDGEKRRLATICAERRIPVIEDDIYGDLSFGPRPGALKSWDHDGVVYVSSLSKMLAPGYRIGWAAGGRHHQDLLRCHGMAALSVPLPNQTALALYLEDGGLKGHLKTLRRRYAENMAYARSAVAQYFPAGTGTGNPQGGHFLWVRLPGRCNAGEIAAAALRRGISVAPGTIFSSRGHYGNHLRINTAVSWTNRVAGAIKVLGELAVDAG